DSDERLSRARRNSVRWAPDNAKMSFNVSGNPPRVPAHVGVSKRAGEDHTSLVASVTLALREAGLDPKFIESRGDLVRGVLTALEGVPARDVSIVLRWPRFLGRIEHLKRGLARQSAEVFIRNDCKLVVSGLVDSVRQLNGAQVLPGTELRV